MTTIFELPGELTIYSALDTRDALLAWATEQTAKPHRTLQVSASQVEEVDGSGLQLLAALTNMDLNWELVGASPKFSEACKTMGLTDWLRAAPLPQNGSPA
jgi:ABC-type transporter Mla MlaB component